MQRRLVIPNLRVKLVPLGAQRRLGQLEAFIAADPFCKAGVYESVAVRAFKKVFPQG